MVNTVYSYQSYFAFLGTYIWPHAFSVDKNTENAFTFEHLRHESAHLRHERLVVSKKICSAQWSDYLGKTVQTNRNDWNLGIFLYILNESLHTMCHMRALFNFSNKAFLCQSLPKHEKFKQFSAFHSNERPKNHAKKLF